MTRPQLKLVSTQSPEALLIRRLTEAKEAWGALIMAPHLPQTWVAWFSALDRLEAERIRYHKGTCTSKLGKGK